MAYGAGYSKGGLATFAMKQEAPGMDFRATLGSRRMTP
jgi:hypothetical protein